MEPRPEDGVPLTCSVLISLLLAIHEGYLARLNRRHFAANSRISIARAYPSLDLLRELLRFNLRVKVAGSLRRRHFGILSRDCDRRWWLKAAL